MPRRKSVNLIRDIGLDPKYNSEVVQKLINVIMLQGKKNIARGIVYDALDIISAKINGDTEKTLKYFLEALDLIMPAVEVRPRRVGGSVYQIPMEVPYARSRALAMRWIIKAASVRADKTMGQRLAHEFIDAHENRGAAVKRRLDVHKMAESNRAFAHYAW